MVMHAETAFDDAWERGEREPDTGVTDQPQISAEHPDPRRITEALAAVRNRPPPKDPSSIGCLAAIGATVVMVLLPLVARFTGLSSTALWIIGAGMGVTVLFGGLLGIFGGAFVRGAVASDVGEAIDELAAAYPNGDPGILLQAAVRILDGSTVSTGPATVETFDRKQVAERLGDALAYLLSVERILLQQDEIYPCFTLLESASGDRDGGWQWMEDET
jgi:hypothetical protein